MLIDILIIVWMHFIADFVLQSDKVARGKSSSNKILVKHVCLYSIPFFWFGWQFAVINAVAHFATDWITSRITKRLWANSEVHWFFVVIGLDQAIHFTTLIGTYAWLIM